MSIAKAIIKETIFITTFAQPKVLRNGYRNFTHFLFGAYVMLRYLYGLINTFGLVTIYDLFCEPEKFSGELL